jgi:hypothetical protein
LADQAHGVEAPLLFQHREGVHTRQRPSVGRAVHLIDAHQTIGYAVAAVRQERGIAHGEDRGRRAERPAEDDDHRECEHRACRERAAGVAHVGGEILQRPDAAGVANVFLHLVQSADGDQCLPPGLTGRGAARDPVGDVALQVERHFVIELAIRTAAQEERAAAFGEIGQE